MRFELFTVYWRLQRAYGHLWANLLDFGEPWPNGSTRGEWVHHCARAGEEWALLAVAAREAMDRGECPDLDAVASACALYTDDPCIDGPLQRHTTCSHQTRWAVLEDGEVRFERVGHVRASDYYDVRPVVLARSRVYTDRAGRRVAFVDTVVPIAQWGEYDIYEQDQSLARESHVEGVLRALRAAGCSDAEARRALDAGDTDYARRHPMCRFELAG